MGFRWETTPCIVMWNCDFETDQREAVRAAMSEWNGVADTDGSGLVASYLTNYVDLQRIFRISWLSPHSRIWEMTVSSEIIE